MEVKGKLVAGGAWKAERKAHEIKCYVWDLWMTWSKEHYKYSGWKGLIQNDLNGQKQEV